MHSYATYKYFGCTTPFQPPPCKAGSPTPSQSKAFYALYPPLVGHSADLVFSDWPESTRGRGVWRQGDPCETAAAQATL